jgi:hypothetical protein
LEIGWRNSKGTVSALPLMRVSTKALSMTAIGLLRLWETKLGRTYARWPLAARFVEKGTWAAKFHFSNLLPHEQKNGAPHFQSDARLSVFLYCS